MRRGADAVPPRRLAWMAFFLSAAVLGFEIALMRMLLVASWHHFAFLVISIVLLGFGASGTALTLLRHRVRRNPGAFLTLLCLATAASMPIVATVAGSVPVEARFVPALLWEHVAWWLLFWCLLTVPFLLGAAGLGAALMVAEERIPTVYAANLFGSAAGAVAAPALMSIVAPAWLPVVMALPALVAAAFVPWRRNVRVVAIAGLLGAGAVALTIVPPAVRLDPYKYGAFVERLERQGEATLVATRHGPRARVRAYRSDLLHDLPFLGIGATPPSLSVITRDGHWAGSVLDVDGAREAAAVDHVLAAFAYELVGADTRVALLGETGGANVWLARRRGATRIDVVQGDANVIDLLRGPLADAGGRVIDEPGVQVFVTEPRHFVDHPPQRYDIIQLVGHEGSAAGSGGVGGLGEDHLLTVAGLGAALDALSPRGLLVACRGIQSPPRDNVKLLATAAAALERRGAEEPGRHVVVVRDYLGVCTVVRPTEFTPEDIERIRAVCRTRQLTPVWFDGIRPDELNQPDALPGPEDDGGDWYHYAATRLFGPDRERFLDEWLFDIVPARDDRPFFHDFFRRTSIAPMREAFGDLWLTRTELGYAFVVAATIAIAIVAALLIPLPLRALPRTGTARGRSATAAYFFAIGLAYLLLEMTVLSRLHFVMGDPVTAAAITIGGFLLFSGAGSLTAQRREGLDDRVLRMIMTTLIVVAAATVIAFHAAHTIGGWPFMGRGVVALAAIGPLAYLMGFPMPAALARLQRGAPDLVPWAWGINGFASVLAAPLALLAAMTWGYVVVAVAAGVLYAVAAIVLPVLPREQLSA